MTTSTISYGRLAREVGYGEPPRIGHSVLSWLEGDELYHLDEMQWAAFLTAFKLSPELQPGTLVDEQTAQAIRAAAELDPGAEKPWSVQDDLDELTSTAMTEIHKETMAAVKAVLTIGQGSGMQLLSDAGAEGLVDAILGRCSPIVRQCASDAYNMHR